MNISQEAEAWLAERPPIIRELYNKYPPGTAFMIHGKPMWVIAYREDGSIKVTPIPPIMNHDLAVNMAVTVCSCCANKLDSIKI